MAISPQAVVFGLQSTMQLSNADRMAYQGKVLDEDIAFRDIKMLYGEIEIAAIARINKIKTSTDLSDQQVTIALYRLAAFASLEAGTHHAADHSDAGAQLCDSLSNAAPPRDCALLDMVGSYEAAEAFARDVELLKSMSVAD